MTDEIKHFLNCTLLHGEKFTNFIVQNHQHCTVSPERQVWGDDMATKTIPNLIILFITLGLLALLSSCSNNTRETAGEIQSSFGVAIDSILTPAEIETRLDLSEVETDMDKRGLYFALNSSGRLVMWIKPTHLHKPSAYFMEVIEDFIEEAQEILDSIEKEYPINSNPFADYYQKLQTAQVALDDLSMHYPSIAFLKQ